MSIRTCIAIINEKGGTAKTTTSVNLAAALGEQGQRVLLVDLDGQAASSRWVGVEEDNRLAEAMARGGGLVPIPEVMPNVSLVPASGKLDSIAHDLRPTQGGQLRRILGEVADNYDYIIIDCPPSLGNRLIANGLLAATHVIVPVETSILALDGLKILLTTLEDVRDGFGHDIVLAGVLACRYDGRTRLSRLVLEELRRALPGRVFNTLIRENVRMRECPASGQSILAFAPDSPGAADYRALATELLAQPQAWRQAVAHESGQHSVENLRNNAAASLRESAHKNGKDDDQSLVMEGPENVEHAATPEPAPTSPIEDPAPAAQPQAQPQMSWADVLAQAEQRVQDELKAVTPPDEQPAQTPEPDVSESQMVTIGGANAEPLEQAPGESPWSEEPQEQAADLEDEMTMTLPKAPQWPVSDLPVRQKDDTLSALPLPEMGSPHAKDPSPQAADAEPPQKSLADILAGVQSEDQTPATHTTDAGETPATHADAMPGGLMGEILAAPPMESLSQTAQSGIGLPSGKCGDGDAALHGQHGEEVANRMPDASETAATQATDAGETLATHASVAAQTPSSHAGGDNFPALRAYLKQMQQEGRMPAKPAPTPQGPKKGGFKALFQKVVGTK